MSMQLGDGKGLTRGRTSLLLAALLFLLSTTLLATGGTQQKTALADCEPSTPYLTYTVSHTEAESYGNGDDQGFQGTTTLSFDSKSHSMSYFEVSIRYNNDLFEIPQVVYNQTGYYSFPGSWTLTAVNNVPGWVFFKGQWDPNLQNSLVFDGATPIFGIVLKTKCALAGQWQDVVIRDTIKSGITRANQGTYTGLTYAVCGKDDGYCSIPDLYYQACTKVPGTYYLDTSYVGEKNVSMPVRFDNNYAINYFDVTMTYPTAYLDYDSVSFIGAAGGPAGPNYTVTVNTTAGTIRVVSTNAFVPTSYCTLFTPFFDIKENLMPPLTITPTITSFQALRKEGGVTCYGDILSFTFLGPFQSFYIPSNCEPSTPYLKYTMSNVQAEPYGNGDDQGFEGTTTLSFDSKSHSMSYFEVSIRYNYDLFEIPQVVYNQTGYYSFPGSWTLTAVNNIPGWVFFKGQWDPGSPNPLVFDGTSPIFGIVLKTKCQIADQWQDVVIRDTIKNGITRINQGTYDGITYWVCDKTDGYCNVPELFYQACTKVPGTYYLDTSYVGEKNVSMPVRYDNNFAINYFDVTMTYPTTYLDYDSVSFIGAAGGPAGPNYTVTVNTGAGTIRVVCTSPFVPTTYCTLFTPYFNIKNNLTPPLTITPTITSFQALRKEGGVTCYGDNVTFYFLGPFQSFYIPTYTATLKTVSKTIPGTPSSSRRDTLAVQMKQNFPIGDQSSNINVISYSIRKSTTCYALEPTQKSVINYGGGNFSYWETVPHYKRVQGGGLEEDGIIRRESASALFPLRGVTPTFTAIDSIIVNPDEVANCSAPIKLFADRSPEYDNNEYHIDTYIHPDYVSFTLYADTLDPDSPIKFESGTFKIYTPIQQSCPYVFAWDGERFVEENTILQPVGSGALAKPSPDFLALKTPLQPDNGVYRIQVREQEYEQTTIDAFQLSAIDRPAGTILNVNNEGVTSVFRDELFPLSAVDELGNDHLDEVVGEDGLAYSADESGSLTFTFQPGKNFDWADATVGLGQIILPPDQCKIPKQAAGMQKNELFIEILSLNGEWIALSDPTMRANGSDAMPTFNPKDYAIDGQITIRHRWVGSYYSDKISLYLPSKEPWTRTDLTLAAANHNADGDILSFVVAADDLTVSLIPGQTIALAFPADQIAPVQPGYVREFVFSAKGYYTTYAGPAALPQVYELQQNYPNPFNPTTMIYYTLPTAADINLTVYNMLGQKVKTLVSAMQNAGEHSVEWDGTDDSGTQVASGVYFYKLTAPDYSATRKMMLIK